MRRTHGRSHTPIWNRWRQFRFDYPVCARWKRFEHFLTDMGEIPKGAKLRRLDQTKPYYKANCEWRVDHHHGQSSSRQASRTYGTWAKFRHEPRCARWERFENFLADMGERPINVGFVRVNDSKPYSKANCRWVTSKDPLFVKRYPRGRWITLDGERLLVTEWAKKMGIPRGTIYSRLRKGWGKSWAVTIPRQKQYAKRRARS